MIAHVFDGEGVGFWVPLVMISLNIFFKKLILFMCVQINFLFEKYIQENHHQGYPKPTPSPSKTCAINRSRGVDVFKKKSLLEKSICEQSYQHPKFLKKNIIFALGSQNRPNPCPNFLRLLFSVWSCAP